MGMDYLDMDNEYPEIDKQDFDLDSNDFIDRSSLGTGYDVENGTSDDLLLTDDSLTNEASANPLSPQNTLDITREESHFTTGNNYKELSYHHGSEISFMGYGRCECGCGSFVGSGNICRACHHPFDAHSRYKK